MNALSGIEVVNRISVLNPYTYILDILFSIREKKKQPKAVRWGLHISFVRNSVMLGAALVN